MQSPPPRQSPSRGASTAGIPSFETKLENEEEILDALLVAQAKNILDPNVWQELHDAAVRFDPPLPDGYDFEKALEANRGKEYRSVISSTSKEV